VEVFEAWLKHHEFGKERRVRNHNNNRRNQDLDRNASTGTQKRF
jgi:hypothetical protein